MYGNGMQGFRVDYCKGSGFTTASMVYRGMTTSCFAAELGEEGLLLDALAVVAQPLAAVMAAISPESCRAAGISKSQLKLNLDRAPYQLQLQLHQVCH